MPSRSRFVQATVFPRLLYYNDKKAAHGGDLMSKGAFPMDCKIEAAPIFITGAAGFIGYHLALRLLAKGHAVHGMDNLNAYYEVALKKERLKRLSYYPGFSFTEGDISDKDVVEGIFTKLSPKIVVNLAAQAGVRYSIDHPRRLQS